jgi:hypothetical protein
MDYSTTINEGEDAVGESPWGNSPASSPQHNRTGFEPTSGDGAAPPFGFTPAPSNGLAPAGDGDPFQRPGTTDAAASGEDAGQAAGQHGSHVEHQTPSAEHPQSAESQGPSDGQEAQPAHGQRAQRPAQPQYRLQAKITGLERTGKKDPVLRFDVHVNAPIICH